MCNRAATVRKTLLGRVHVFRGSMLQHRSLFVDWYLIVGCLRPARAACSGQSRSFVTNIRVPNVGERSLPYVDLHRDMPVLAFFYAHELDNI